MCIYIYNIYKHIYKGIDGNNYLNQTWFFGKPGKHTFCRFFPVAVGWVLVFFAVTKDGRNAKP